MLCRLDMATASPSKNLSARAEELESLDVRYQVKEMSSADDLPSSLDL
jgi:hypothetical protein